MAAEDTADGRFVWACLGNERMAAVLGGSMGMVQKGGFGKHRVVTTRLEVARCIADIA